MLSVPLPHCTAVEECAKGSDVTIAQRILQSPQIDAYFQSERPLEGGPFLRALTNAARGDNPSMVQLLLELVAAKAAPWRWELGHLALHMASLGGRVQMIETLL